MIQKKLDAEAKRLLLEDYETYDPESESVDAVAERHGVTRQTLFRIIREEGVVPRSHRHGGGPRRARPPTSPDVPVAYDRLVNQLIDELVQVRMERDQLRRELEEFRRP